MKAQVEYIILPFKKRLDGFTYWQRELEPAIHPALKAYVKAENATGGVFFGYDILGNCQEHGSFFAVILKQIVMCECS